MENSENSLKFTEAENKIRKKWLFWSTMLPAVILGCFIIFAIFSFFISSNFMAMGGILVLSLLLTGGFYMNYYCAYKNPGTILLLLGMIGTSLNLATFFKPENLALMKASIIFLLFMLIMLFFELIVLYYSYKLRKINKKMQERKLIASPVYINALSVFSAAANLEELNEQFTKLRTSHDSGNAVEILAKAYNQQKKMLNF
jgi:hypothetical protein